MSLSRRRRNRHRNWDYKRRDVASYVSTEDLQLDIVPSARDLLQPAEAVRGRSLRLETRSAAQMDSRPEPHATAGPSPRLSATGARVRWRASERLPTARVCRDVRVRGKCHHAHQVLPGCPRT